MSEADTKIAIEVTERDGTVIPLGDVVGSSPERVRAAIRERVESRKQDLPPSGEISCSGSIDCGKPTVAQVLSPSGGTSA